MKFGKVIMLSCVAAGLATGCVSIGNSGMEDLSNLSREERAELEQGMEEMRTELDEVSTEFYGALDEARSEMQEELDGAGWIREMICEGVERPRKVFWQKGDTVAEIGDREEFAENLAVEDWKASTEDTEGLEVDSVYTIQWKKSIGLLDGRKNEYVDMGTLTVYRDSNLVAARICVMDEIFGKMQGLLGEGGTGMDFTIVYEVPDKALEFLRGPVEQ